MRNFKIYIVVAIVLFIGLISSSARAASHGTKGGAHKPVILDGDTVNISGVVLDSHKETIGEAEVIVRVNGKEIDRIETAFNGKYISRFMFEKEIIQSSTIHIEAHKTSFKTQIGKSVYGIGS